MLTFFACITWINEFLPVFDQFFVCHIQDETRGHSSKKSVLLKFWGTKKIQCIFGAIGGIKLLEIVKRFGKLMNSWWKMKNHLHHTDCFNFENLPWYGILDIHHHTVTKQTNAFQVSPWCTSRKINHKKIRSRTVVVGGAKRLRASTH